MLQSQRSLCRSPSFAPSGLVCFSTCTHGLRRGLHSGAASRLYTESRAHFADDQPAMTQTPAAPAVGSSCLKSERGGLARAGLVRDGECGIGQIQKQEQGQKRRTGVSALHVLKVKGLCSLRPGNPRFRKARNLGHPAKRKTRPKTKTKSKSGGQECPPYTYSRSKA